MSKLAFYEFATSDLLITQLADTISTELSAAISQRDQASFIVSGGNSPKPLFEQLAKRSLAWQKVLITLSDERWVDTNFSDSNEYLVRSALLIDQAKTATFIGLKTADVSPEAGMQRCNDQLSAVPLPSDICLLGMGLDGHTASFFPHADHLSEALALKNRNRCQAITPTTAPFPRMTLTLATLLNCRHIILLLIGKEKRAVYQQALVPGSETEIPVRAILKQDHTPVSVYWSP